MDFMKGFGIGAVIGLKEITSYQAVRWDFGNFFIPFGFPRMIVVDADVFVSGMIRNTLQETLLISVHAFARNNHKTMIY